jgi:hypothetical protein
MNTPALGYNKSVLQTGKQNLSFIRKDVPTVKTEGGMALKMICEFSNL